MKRNRILLFAEIFFKFLTVLIGIIIASSIIIYIHSEISPKSYDKVIWNVQQGYSFVYDKDAPEPPRTFSEFKEGLNERVYVSKLDFSSKAYPLVHLIVILFFSFLIVNQ